LEVHLFDFDGDLYGEWIRVEWVQRLRDVTAFPSAHELRQQLNRDQDHARQILGA
jgi:riboflavin kinase/FMN adenylyltransferase